MPNDRLVILSIPFQRLIRSHLSQIVLDIITKSADVVIVSPFFNNLDFLNQLKGDSSISHVASISQGEHPWIFRKLIAISNAMRIRGYWFRNRKRIPYYWANRHMILGENGTDVILSLPKQVAMDILAWIGCWPRAWLILDSLIGTWAYNNPHLASRASKYRHVTLILATSWDFQDQSLGWMARKHQWRTILLPYTSDQLFTNGFLYCNFDSVCVQGEVERQFAFDLHNINPSKVVKLGSTYMKALEIFNGAVSDKITRSQSHELRVMYAGLSNIYFPTECEIQALNMLLDLKFHPDTVAFDIIYRPVGFSEEFARLLLSELICNKDVELQIPSVTSIGMASYSPTNTSLDLQRLLRNLSSIDVLITSSVTSLSFEAALLGVPTIAYFPLDNPVLRKRNAHLALNDDSRVIGLESVLVAKSLKELANILCELFNNPEMRKEIADNTCKEWDYAESDYSALLYDTLFLKA